MDSNTHMLQSNINFADNHLDVLTFISPTALQIGSDPYWQALQTVNYVNWFTKSMGRFYIDSNANLAYSLRINYDFLDREPYMAIKEIEIAIDYYTDLFIPFLDVCLGKKTFKDTKQFIDEMWGDMK